jgi:GTPase SAR1 family protein
LVYDVTSNFIWYTGRVSFNGIGKWIEDVKSQRGSEVIICLVGNKIDLPDREVTEQEGLDIAQKHDLLFKEVSAKSGVNIQEFFKEVAARLPGTSDNNTKPTLQTLPQEEHRIIIDSKPHHQEAMQEKKRCCWFF